MNTVNGPEMKDTNTQF